MNTDKPNKNPRLTLADYHDLPEGPPHYEFEEGVLIPMNRPHAQHQETIGVLFAAIRAHVVPNNLGRLW